MEQTDSSDNRPKGNASIFDTEKLSETIIELTIALKNVQLYPDSHDQVTYSLDRCFGVMEEMLKFQQEFTIGVANDMLIVGDRFFDPKHPVYKRFSMALKNHDIAAITFSQGVAKQEVLTFLNYISIPPDQVTENNELKKRLHHTSLPNIKIELIDYSKFNITKENEIYRPASIDENIKQDHIWEDFITNLISGTLSSFDPSEVKPVSASLNPEKLGQFINRHHKNPRSIIQNYEKCIASYLREADTHLNSLPMNRKAFSEIDKFLKGLNPKLRKQFLSSTFKTISSASNKATSVFINGLSENLVVEMLQSASSQGKEISPTLMALVHKMLDTSGPPMGGPVADRQQKSDSTRDTNISAQELQDLFEREDYEDFVIPEYDATLKEIYTEPIQKFPDIENSFRIDDYLDTFEDQHLNIKISKAALYFLNQDIEHDVYADYAVKLSGMVEPLLNDAEFTLLKDICLSFKRHRAEKQDEAISTMAGKFADKFTDLLFMRKTISVIEQPTGIDEDGAFEFLNSLGHEIVPVIIYHFLKNGNFIKESIHLKILSVFKNDTFNILNKHLSTPDFPYAENVLDLILKLKATELTPGVITLLKHNKADIREKALTTLLEFNDDEAVLELKRRLNLKDVKARSRAILLAGEYRVTAVAEQLACMIKKPYLPLNATCRKNEEIIAALDKIKDPCVIPWMEKLAHVRCLFQTKAFHQMKTAVTTSLEGYPYEVLRSCEAEKTDQ